MTSTRDDLEATLRARLTARADDLPVTTNAWATVRSRTVRRHWTGWAVTVAAVVAVIVGGAQLVGAMQLSEPEPFGSASGAASDGRSPATSTPSATPRPSGARGAPDSSQTSPVPEQTTAPTDPASWAAVDLGPELSVQDLGGLVAGTVLVDLGSDAETLVVLADDGVVGHVPAAGLQRLVAATHTPRPGKALVWAEQPDGVRATWEVGPGEVIDILMPFTPLADDHAVHWDGPLEYSEILVYEPGGSVVHQFASGAPWVISPDRDMVSHWTGENADAPTSSGVAWTTANELIDLPEHCLAHDRLGDDLLLVCHDSQAGPEAGWTSIRRLDPAAGTTQLVGPIRWPEMTIAVGHWRKASVSPDGQWLGLEYSAECEVPTAMFTAVDGGQPVPFVAAPRPASPDGNALDGAVSSRLLGWTVDSRALVALDASPCGRSAATTGLYAISPGGDPELLLSTAGRDLAAAVVAP